MVKHCFLYTLVNYAEAFNLFPARNDKHNDVQSMLLLISQSQEDRQYVRNFLASITDSNSKADFEYINNSIAKTMKNVFLSVISSIINPILSGIMTILLFLSLFWSVVLTRLAFKYFISIGMAKIRDRKTYARRERIILDEELLSKETNNYNFISIQYILCNVRTKILVCITHMCVLFDVHEY